MQEPPPPDKMAALEKHAENERNATRLPVAQEFLARQLERVRRTIRRTFVTNEQLKGDDIIAIDPNGSPVRRSSQFAQAMNELRKLWSGNADVKGKAEVDISNIISLKAKPEDYKTFVDILRLEDIREDMTKGIPRAVGYGLDEVHFKLNELYTQAEQNPVALELLERHKRLTNGIRDVLIAEGLISPETAREFYYPHDVIDYLRDPLVRTKRPPGGARWGLSGNVKKRGGTVRELDMNYIDVMEKYLTNQYTMLAKRKIVRTMLQSVDLRASPNQYLDEAGKPIQWEEGAPIPAGFHWYNEMTGMQRLRAQGIAERMMFESMDFDGLDAYAKYLDIDRATLDAEINRMFGNEEKFLNAVEGSKILSKDHMYLIPDEVASTLAETMNSLNRLDKEGAFAKATKWWKTGVLNFAPIRYNFRNLVGDVQRAYIQFGNDFFDDDIFKQVVGDTYNYYKNKTPSPHMRGMLDNAVTTSGMWRQEAPLSMRRPDFIKLQHGQDMSPAQKISRNVWEVLRKVPEYSAMREDIMRGMIYQMNLRRAMRGEKMLTGIADNNIVEGLLQRGDVEGAAGYIARKSLGDYGDMTFVEQKVRSTLLPFYGWMKVNTQFWGGLTKAIATGQAEGSMGRASKAAIARGTVVTLSLMGMARAWNEQVHGDIEEELPDNIKKTSHIVLGRDENGKPMVISLNDAMDDMLTMLGADKAIPEAYAVMRGTLSKEEYARRQRENATLWGWVPGKGVVRQLWTQLGPVPQIATQAMAKKRFFPDPFNPSDIPPEQFASSIRDILGVGALGLDKFATDVDLTGGQVFQPTTTFFDVPRQLGFRRTSTPTMMQEAGAGSRYEAEMVKQIGRLEKSLQDLEGRYDRLRGGEANRQLDPEARENMVQAMEVQRDKQIQELKDLVARYKRLREATR